MALKPPCNNCPWRKDAPKRHWADDHFEDIYRSCRGDGFHEMLCHKATGKDGTINKNLFCRGWVAVMGFDAIGVRVLAMKGLVKKEDVVKAERKGLFRTFEAMMKANRIPLPVLDFHNSGIISRIPVDKKPKSE